MTIQFRHYEDPADYQLVSDFLLEHYQSNNRDGNWIEPAWEYMHYHPLLNHSILEKIGIWEENGKIAAVVHYEWRLGEAFFEFHQAYKHLAPELVEYAEANFAGVSEKDGRRFLCAYVNDNDEEFLSLVRRNGYTLDPEKTRPFYRFDVPDPFPAILISPGFQLKSLADECDWSKVNRVLWRGFNNPGEPPSGEKDLEERRIMFDTPRGRRDLKIVVAAPNGDFVAFCGMFYEENHHFAYVEPVATDPDYRRLGLGKAAVLEGIRRCALLGADIAYVGSDQEFYQAIGFKKVYDSQCWRKVLEG
jgi:GNAT superfamily N-acetyltransferase